MEKSFLMSGTVIENCLNSITTSIPIINSQIGRFEKYVKDSSTGILFASGIMGLGHQTRLEYETKYIPEINYQKMIAIYQQVLRQS
jgi:hypothetical protein